MLEYAFGQGKDVVALKRASFAADRGAGSQEIFRSYRHGMAEPVESPNAARGKANRFISHSLARARALAADGDRDGALAELGAAFHTMMDQASPAHTDENGNPREWGGMNNLNGLRKHIARESGRPSKEVMDATAERMRAAYTSVFGKP